VKRENGHFKVAHFCQKKVCICTHIPLLGANIYELFQLFDCGGFFPITDGAIFKENDLHWNFISLLFFYSGDKNDDEKEFFLRPFVKVSKSKDKHI
jgi:hypothetical protein